MNENHNKRKMIIWGMTGSFLLIGLIVFLYWLFILRFEVSTRDAYVHGNQVVVTPQISGFVTSISVNDTDKVRQGRILVQLDRIDKKMAYAKAKEHLAETVRNVTGLFEKVGSLKADLQMKKAQMIRSAQDYKHRKALIQSGSVSKENLQHAKADFISTFASVIFVQHELKAAIAMIEGTSVETHPLVKQAGDAVTISFVNLQRCTVRSPVHGIVAMKKVEVGESIASDTPLMKVIPFDQIWINANFKETHLKNVRIGQPVTMTSDIYGNDVIFHGKVVGLSAGTGSVFSALPPQNATGNWIKIVQRLPVRICLDPEEIERHPLRLGLSIHVTIDIRDTSGKMLPAPSPPRPLYETGIFKEQEVGAEKIIESIIQNNTFDQENESE